MSEKLWFVTNGVSPIAVHKEESPAREELRRFADDPDFNYYSCYSLRISELDDYPEEYDLAYDKGVLS
ncbi:MAG: hypothetical protein PQJ60_15000 [Spirochaetales bacterium]|nr:hypothetical protein [Spirochaetales bacterium]